MKNYLLVLLSVFALGFLINNYAPEPQKEYNLEPTSEQREAYEDIKLPEKSLAEAIAIENVTEKAEITAPAASYAAPRAASSPSGYVVTKNTAQLVAKPSYQDIYRTRKLVYAHNSANLFGNLKNLRAGSTFNLVESGIVTTYRVAVVKHFMKTTDGGDLGECDANWQNCTGRWMSTIVNYAFNHDVALMTCHGGAGTPYRLIILADKA